MCRHVGWENVWPHISRACTPRATSQYSSLKDRADVVFSPACSVIASNPLFFFFSFFFLSRAHHKALTLVSRTRSDIHRHRRRRQSSFDLVTYIIYYFYTKSLYYIRSTDFKSQHTLVYTVHRIHAGPSYYYEAGVFFRILEIFSLRLLPPPQTRAYCFERTSSSRAHETTDAKIDPRKPFGVFRKSHFDSA